MTRHYREQSKLVKEGRQLVSIAFTDSEHEEIMVAVRKSGHNRTAFLKTLIMDKVRNEK